MPLPQRNFGYFTYESADGTSYNLRVDADWAAIAGHGLAARVTGQPRYIASKRQRPRMVVYVDLTTGRSRTGPVGTAAAFTALNIGDTHDFPVVGQAGLVTYTLAAKVEEKVPGSVVRLALPDHA
jgi:hypothetical protein